MAIPPEVQTVPPAATSVAPEDSGDLRAGTSATRLAGRARLLVGPVVVIGAWQLMTSTGMIGGDLLPSPLTVARSWWTWLAGSGSGIFDGTWPAAALATGVRVWIGFAIAAVLGIGLGVLMGFSRVASQLLDPVVQLFRPMPAVAWVPLAIVFFGFTPSATIFLVAYGSFFPIVLNAAAGVSRTQRSYVLVGMMLGASRWQMLTRIMCPAALPAIFTGLRLGIGNAWILGIVGELIAVRSGLGASLMQAYSVFRYDIIIAAMASFGILGFLSDRLVVRLERRLLSWRRGYDVETS